MINEYSKGACSILRNIAGEKAKLSKHISAIAQEGGYPIDEEPMTAEEYYESDRRDICSGDNEAMGGFTHYALAVNSQFVYNLVRETFGGDQEWSDIFTEDYDGDYDPIDS